MEYKDVDDPIDLIPDSPVERINSPTGETTPTPASPTPTSPPGYPFKRWVDSFRPRRRIPPGRRERVVEGWLTEPDKHSRDQSDLDPPNFPPPDPQWERSSGHSSHLGTIKTMTMSIAGHSLSRSRATTRSTATQSALSDARPSAESSRPASSNHIDEQADLRARKRRQVLRELVTTEVDYVAGLKALTGILSILNARIQIQYNTQRMYEVHERFLHRLQEKSPSSTRAPPDEGSETISSGLSKRLAALDIAKLKNKSFRSRSFKAGVEKRRRSIFAEPNETLDVAREIEVLSASFSVYEEFCRNYELLSQDIALLRRTVPNWLIYDQGIEALSKSVASTNSRRHEENKSMSMSDLMIKPIQRLCKYPLLLLDMLKSTPSSDCPDSNNAIQQILEQIRILVAQINSATGNPVNKDRIQKTLVLQERIQFNEMYELRDVYRELGPLILCGVLHVTYRTTEYTAGQFMVCVLFNCHFLLARNIDDSNRLDIVASIYISDLRPDSVQNGNGLLCYSCPYSWKILFQHQDENFEFVLSASTSTEEKQWQTEMLRCSAALAEMAQPQPGGVWDPRKYSLLNLSLAPLDRAQYAVSSLARRSSMDSVAVSRKSNVQHIFIRKTNCQHSFDETRENMGEIERPKAPVTRGALNVTAKRTDRIRLERLIADLYTRDVLPWPGMIIGRGELFRRGSIMRRLSFHAGFNKRSGSVSTSHSGPVVESHSVEDYDGEEKDLITTHDGAGDQNLSEVDCESPKTPTSPLGRSRTLKFVSTPRKSLTLPREESNAELTPPRRKWSSPISLLSVLSPKNLIRPRADPESDE